MLLAHLVPTQFLERLDVGNDYSFVEAHPFLQDPKYRNYFCNQIESGDRDLTILDSSVTKLGQPLPTDQILMAAKIIDQLDPKPRRFEIVAPDIIKDYAQTMKLFKEFLEEFKKSLIDATLMAVPQGENEAAWFSSYQELILHPEVSSVGIAYRMHFDVEHVLRTSEIQDSFREWTERRIQITQILEDEDYVDPRLSYHLLGSGNPLELKEQVRHDWIRSTDTSSAFKHGQAGVRFDPEIGIEERISRPMQFGDRYTKILPETKANMAQMWKWLGREDKIRKRRSR